MDRNIDNNVDNNIIQTEYSELMQKSYIDSVSYTHLTLPTIYSV